MSSPCAIRYVEVKESGREGRGRRGRGGREMRGEREGEERRREGGGGEGGRKRDNGGRRGRGKGGRRGRGGSVDEGDEKISLVMGVSKGEGSWMQCADASMFVWVFTHVCRIGVRESITCMSSCRQTHFIHCENTVISLIETRNNHTEFIPFMASYLTYM